MIPRKATLISTGLLSLAVILKLSLPVVADFATTQLSVIYRSFLTWVRPPYVYLLMNCIIISIVASSKLQLQKSNQDKEPSSSQPVVVAGDEFSGVVIEKEEEEEEDKEKEKAVSVSLRFNITESEQTSVEASKISKPHLQNTLASTWKTITCERRKPLTKHLKKSDTWDSHLRRDVTPKPNLEKSQSLRREPSLSQDELNQRVEAFIMKFNNELKRQASLNY